jgi:hypothetical protein
MFHDIDMIIFGIGCVGWHNNGTDRHNSQIGNGPFGAVFCANQNTVARLYASGNQGTSQTPDRVGNLVPVFTRPFAFALMEQKRLRTKHGRIFKKGTGKIGFGDITGHIGLFCGRAHALLSFGWLLSGDKPIEKSGKCNAIDRNLAFGFEAFCLRAAP